MVTLAHLQATVAAHEHVSDTMRRHGHVVNAEGPQGLAVEAAGQNSAGVIHAGVRGCPCAGCSRCLWQPASSILYTKPLV